VCRDTSAVSVSLPQLTFSVSCAVRLRGLPQATPQVCKGAAYCSKDCQVCVASCSSCLLLMFFASCISGVYL